MEASQQRRKITRNRQFRSCTECRQRKLKCDRESPCLACTRRNEAGTCVYAASPRRHGPGTERRSVAEARLEHLEQLVKELSGNHEAGATNESLTIHGNPAPEAFSTLSLIDDTFKGATHWSAMLDDVEELRYSLYDQKDLELDGVADDEEGFGVLFGAVGTLPLGQVLDHFLPTRQDTNRLVAMYFRSRAIIAPCLHASQFNRQYEAFWTEPAATSPLWMSILFSILNIATSVLASPQNENTVPSSYVLAAAHCLAIGGYHKPQPFALEAMLLFAHAKCLRCNDMSPDLAIIHSSAVRLATIMGYHRDPSIMKSSVTAFQAEMRRRTWSLCMQLDLLISFQLGLPSNVQYPTWNTAPPSNLLISDFDETTTYLPPARPETEITDILFYIAKHKMMVVFEKIIRHAGSATTTPTLAALTALDQELHTAYTSLPALYHPPCDGDSILDPPDLIIGRLCVFSIYYKCLCVLHRPHVLTQHPASITACHAAATALVHRWADAWAEFAPGGTLSSERWFMSTITWHDILLACTTLCLVLCCSQSSGVELDVAVSLQTLQRASAVCRTKASESQSTRRVLRLLEATRRYCSEQRVERGGPQQQEPQPQPQQPQTTVGGIGEMRDELWDAAATAATLGEVRDPTWEYLEQFLDLPDDMDWSLHSFADTEARSVGSWT